VAAERSCRDAELGQSRQTPETSQISLELADLDFSFATPPG
jgi:hypothetical protein